MKLEIEHKIIQIQTATTTATDAKVILEKSYAYCFIWRGYELAALAMRAEGYAEPICALILVSTGAGVMEPIHGADPASLIFRLWDLKPESADYIERTIKDALNGRAGVHGVDVVAKARQRELQGGLN